MVPELGTKMPPVAQRGIGFAIRPYICCVLFCLFPSKYDPGGFIRARGATSSHPGHLPGCRGGDAGTVARASRHETWCKDYGGKNLGDPFCRTSTGYYGRGLTHLVIRLLATSKNWDCDNPTRASSARA